MAKKYDAGVEAVNNLIQTSDGGYAFTSRAWSYLDFPIHPSTIYEVDSSGSLQWNKTIPDFWADTLIQTNDEGYEIAGSWETHHPSTPITIKNGESNTLIKTDSQGNIQWNQNYSSVPDLGVNATFIQTSDGGFAYVEYWRGPSTYDAGGFVKLDSNYNVQWVKNLTYPNPIFSYIKTFPLGLQSLVETSDGALAVLGVGLSQQGFPQTGDIYLVKTEPFLPVPSQTPLPTPNPTPTPTPFPALTVEAAVIASLMITVAVGAGLLFYFKKRKR
jgi:hypothetical protein